MRNTNNWDKYSIPQELEPTKSEKACEIISSIISGIIMFGVLAALLILTGAF